MRVLIAIDAFKGSISAPDVADAIAEGWRVARPDDAIDLLPLADGGEGTAEVIASAVAGAVRHHLSAVAGPDGRPTRSTWIELPGGVAVVDLATMCGLPLMGGRLDPMGAHTRGLGETIAAALDAGMTEVWIGLGGSASTDGGVGALRALGLRVTGDDARPIADGGAGLVNISAVDFLHMRPVPGGVTLLTDVRSPLTGAQGSAAIFSEQKGASSEQITLLDTALRHLARLCGPDPMTPGAGAAGGAAYGFMAAYRSRVVSGIDHLAQLTRLDARIAAADLVITGEGAFDSQSLRGKLVGEVLRRATAAGTDSAVIAGVLRDDPGVPSISLVGLAGRSEIAMAEPARWAERAAQALAHASGASRGASDR